MKLKKIASLALAGVMAVSMLAGCANKPGTTDDEGTKVETTSNAAAVEAMNNGQAATNKVKVEFTDGTDLVTALEKAVQTLGVSSATSIANKNALLSEIVKNTGIGGTYGGTSAKVTLNTFATAPAGTDAVTVLYLDWFDATNVAQSEAIALMNAAKTMNTTIAGLSVNNKTTTMHEGDTYYSYSYTGKTGVLTAKGADNHIYYLVISSITRTGTAETVKSV